MKYIKTYEDLKKIEIGDYVICDEEISDDALVDFLATNVGQIVDFRNEFTVDNLSSDYDVGYDYYIFVKYDDVDIIGKENFNYHNKIPNCRIFSENEIIYNSKDREDCEAFLMSNKYNL